jgi:hypothetical protein
VQSGHGILDEGVHMKTLLMRSIVLAVCVAGVAGSQEPVTYLENQVDKPAV